MNRISGILRSSACKIAVATIVGSFALLPVFGVAAAASHNTKTSPFKLINGSRAPYEVRYSWGTFKLNSRIAKKVKEHKALNIVLSFQTLSSVGAPAELKAGMKFAAKELKKKYGVPIHVQLIGPTTTNTPKQIAQVLTKLQSNEVDALGIQPVSAQSFISIINKAMTDGVPTFTVNTPSPRSRRISYYGVNDTPSGDGVKVAHYTIHWLKTHHIKLKTAALVTGDTTAPWAQGRMKGWVDTMRKAYPGLKIYGTPTNALSTGYDAATTYAKVRAFLIGHPNVQFLFDTDWGGVPIARAIQSLGRAGSVHVIAFNTDPQILKFIGHSPLIAAASQNYYNQGKSFVIGAVNFLLAGKVPKRYEYLKVLMVTPRTVGSFRDRFGKEMGLKAQ